MLVPDLVLLEVKLVLPLVDLFEYVFEATVVTFENGIFRGQVQRVILSIWSRLSPYRYTDEFAYFLQGVLKARMSEARDGFIRVVHRQCHTAIAREIEHFDLSGW